MIDFWRSAIRRQFHASIDMLDNAMQACPDTVWASSLGQGRREFWSLAFHVLFFLDFYLSPHDESDFRPPPPFGLEEFADEVVAAEPPYTKEQLSAYVEHCRERLDAVMAEMTEEWTTSPCPMPYRAMSNGELLLYNLRHVQHHAAQLNMLLRQMTNSAPPDWVSKGPQKSTA